MPHTTRQNIGITPDVIPGNEGQSERPSVHIGFDVGSIAVKAAVLDGDGKVLEHHYRRHYGTPVKITFELLEEILHRHVGKEVATFAGTGTAGRFICKLMDARFINELSCQAAAVRHMVPLARTIIEMGGQDSKLIFLTADQKDAIARQLLSDSWAKDQIAALASGLYAWLDSPDPSPNLSIDVQPLRERLTRGAGSIVRVIVDSWPACSLADVARLATASFGSEGFPYCQPPEPLRSALVSTATQAVQGMAAAMPEKLSLTGAASLIDPAKAEQTKAQLRLVRFALRWAWVIPTSLLGLIMALAVRSWKGLALWWGIPLLGGGLVSFVPVALGPGMTRQYLQQWAASTGMPAIFTDTAKSIGSGLTAAMLRPQFAQAVAISLFGALLVLVGLLLKRKPGVQALTASSVAAQAPQPSPLPIVAPGPALPDAEDRPSGMFG